MNVLKKKWLVLMTTAIILASCCLDPEYIKPTALVLPAEPAWIKISPSEAQQMPRAVYDKFKARDLQHKSYEHELRSIILSTH